MSEATTRLSSAVAHRYRIEREIGSGGMATVYLARDVKHDRDVALKVLRPGLAAVLGVNRFLNEIRISARLDHPHILTLIDSGAIILASFKHATQTLLIPERELPAEGVIVWLTDLLQQLTSAP